MSVFADSPAPCSTSANLSPAPTPNPPHPSAWILFHGSKITVTVSPSLTNDSCPSHHHHKVDAPSGTAMGIVGSICDAVKKDVTKDIVRSPAGCPHPSSTCREFVANHAPFASHTPLADSHPTTSSLHIPLNTLALKLTSLVKFSSATVVRARWARGRGGRSDATPSGWGRR